MVSSALVRGVRVASRNGRSFSINHKMNHINMPETAMITNDGSHVFVRKGWEYSTYMGIIGGPVLLWLGLSNVPETNSKVFAREEALALRQKNQKKKAKTEVLKFVSDNKASTRNVISH